LSGFAFAVAGVDLESAPVEAADGAAPVGGGVVAGWLVAEGESGAGDGAVDGVPATEPGCVESEGCAVAEGFCPLDSSDDNPSCLHRRYPNPAASTSAIRIRKIFPAPPFDSSSSSRR
jgi:hypothetical protein